MSWRSIGQSKIAIASQGAIQGRIGNELFEDYFFNMAMKSFATFDQDMTQTIYENYLGILGVIEIWVASQPREN